MQYCDYVYSIVKLASVELDSIYEDYITRLVGNTGLDALKKAGYLESCGVINGRPLYTLIERRST